MSFARRRLSDAVVPRLVVVALALVTAGCSLRRWSQGLPGTQTPGAVAPAAPPGSTAALRAATAATLTALSPQPDLEYLLRANPMLSRDEVSLDGRTLSDQPQAASESGSAALGSSATFWVADIDQVRFRAITATLRVQTPYIQMWVEHDVDLDHSALERSAQAFGERIYPTNRTYFGQEWNPGIDGDPALIALHARMTGSLGYFSAANELPSRVNPYSNEHEMFVLDASSLLPGTPEYESVLAHEHQHMIHWYQDRNEDAWLNEGASELAEDLSGFGWPGDKVAAFAADPDLQLNAWSDAPAGTMRNYGASYLFLRYFLDRFGPEGLRAVIAHDENGLAGIEAVLRRQGVTHTSDQLFADWVVANLVDRPDVDLRYGYASLDISAGREAHVEAYPFRHDGTVSQYAADYVALGPGMGDAGRANLRIRFEGSPTVKLLPNDAPSGAYQWWSNRGDSSYSYLQRTFDLRKAISATLGFDLWYEIETGWDYGHLRASMDGGQTWSWLRGDHMTDYDPVGNARGPGYTGRSGLPAAQGSAGEAMWVRESVDLTKYVGSEVVLRFDYVTDDAVNWHGLCLDNLALDATGYVDDAETMDDGWTSRGFIRHDNRLKQTYLVQLVTQGETVAVQRLEVGPDGVGEWVVPSPEEDREVTLLISALAPSTTQRASYSLWLEKVREPAGQ